MLGRQAAFWIRPERMQPVHIRIYFTAFPTLARTLCRFGSHRRFVLLFA